jgi:hypothetical protein
VNASGGEGAPGELRCYTSRRAGLSILAGSAGMAVTSIFFLLRLEEPNWGSMLLMSFFPLVTVALYPRWLDRRPRLVLGERGLWARDLGREPIPWTAIRDAELIGGDHAFLGLWLEDEAQRLPQLGLRLRLVARLNRRFGHPPLTVSLLWLDVAPSAILKAVALRLLATERSLSDAQTPPHRP